MKPPSLKSLRIEHLRGSVAPFTLPFEKGKKLTVVYGENGTGKTTICDAFDFLGHGKVGSLENRGLGKTARFWHSFGKSPADAAVTLETDDSATCKARIVKGEVIVDPEDNRPHVEVLRRGQILKLVEADPAKRYAEISRFIDVSGVEVSEKSLLTLIKNLEDNRKEAIAVIASNIHTINQFWHEAGNPGVDAISWAKGESEKAPASADGEIAALTKLRNAYNQLAAQPGFISTAKALVKPAEDALEIANSAEQEALRNVAADSSELLAILKAAQTYFLVQNSPQSCPLCDSRENVVGLVERISNKLDSLAGLRTAQDGVAEAQNSLRRVQQKSEDAVQNANESLKTFKNLVNSSSWPADVPSPSAIEGIESLSEWLITTSAIAEQWYQAEFSRLDATKFLSTLRSAFKTYVENLEAQKDLDTLLPRLKRAHEIIVEERHKFTGEILATIANDVGRIYELVHPGEGINQISLELEAGKRASLQMGASFAGTSGTPPQAYFSESHLDTLGLCVFLALAGLDGPENTILVLDDILASVDEPHVERLIEMLYGEALKFKHCVITTHYRPWKQKLRWGWLKNGQCQFIELAKWTNKDGMTLIRSIPDQERLRLLLAESPPDPQLVCAKAGVILEAALDFLTQLYECSVPRRPNGLYTLGDLLPSIDKKLRVLLRVEVVEVDAAGNKSHVNRNLAPLLEELTRIAQARNVFGCHFNALSFELLETDAVAFGQKVLELIETIADPDAGWPRNRKSGSYWSNSEDTRRLYPLQPPP